MSNNFYDINIEQLKNEIKYGNGVVTAQNYFIQVPNSFMRNPAYNVYEKMIYMYIWGFGGDRRGAYPSQSGMVNGLAISKSTVIRTLKSLEEKGGIYIINRYKKDNLKEKSTNIYYLAEIDINTGTFINKSIDIVRQLYPDKKIFID